MSKERMVKGSVVADMAKLVRAFRDEPWSEHLTAGDLDLCKSMVLPTQWYPMESYQRIALAVFKLVAKGNEDAVKTFGAQAMREMMEGPYRRFLDQNDPHAAVKKWLELRAALFNFSTMAAERTGEKSMTIVISDIGEVGEGAELFNIIVGAHLAELVENNGGQSPRLQSETLVEKGSTTLRLKVEWE